jgi:hypothetical protein
MTLLKILASLIGFTAMLGGLGAFAVGLWLGAKYLLFDPYGPRVVGTPAQSQPDIGLVLACIVGGVVAIYVGTQLGRFARGDFD